jgi:hypothetical protein
MNVKLGEFGRKPNRCTNNHITGGTEINYWKLNFDILYLDRDSNRTRLEYEFIALRLDKRE